MRRKAGKAFMLLGSLMVISALLLFSWNQYQDRQAQINSENILTKQLDLIEENTKTTKSLDFYNTEMKEVEIDGYNYIGYLSIPALNLELPVMSEWDYTRLTIAPCRYSGSTKTDDLVIAAHNYRKHFGLLKTLSAGDEIYFTDMDNVVSAYEVVSVDILNPTAIEEMKSGEYDLTLFTCTYGGASRVTVRCERSEIQSVR